MSKISTWWKYSGILLIITSILHTLVALITSGNAFADMLRDGVFNSVESDLTRSLSFWFLIVGVVCFIFGHTLHYYIKKMEQPAPKFLGWYMLALGIVGSVFAPVSGFFLFILQGIIIVVAKK
jgi:H+/Cl- antiporter ClcA